MASSLVTGLRSLMLATANRQFILDQCAFLSPLVVQVRHKKKNQVSRLKAPHVPKEREKLVKVTKEKTVQVKDPRRTNSPVFLSRLPLDDVWIRTYYPRPRFSLEETIIRHKEAADPSMLDNMDGFIYADMTLDMKTNKKTKFLSGVKATVLLPHQFEQNLQQKIAIFCKREEDVAKAKSLGSSFVGGPELVKQIADGLVNKDEIDVVLCTPDVLPDLLPIRATLRDKFPTKIRGNLSSNLDEMWELFTKGVSYASQKESEAVGKLQVPLGQIKMPVEQLVENFQTYVDSICKERAKSLGPFITEVLMLAPPSRERFMMKVEDYIPGFEVKEVKKDEEEETDSDDEEEEGRVRKK